MEIRTYQQQTSAPNVIAPPRASGEQLVGAGNALSNLGAAVQDTVNIDNKSQIIDLEKQKIALEKVKTSDAVKYAATTLSNGQVHWMDEMQKSKDAAQGAAPNFAGEFLGNYDQWQEQQLAATTDLQAKTILTERLSSLRTELYQHAKTFEAQSRLEDNDAKIDVMRNNAATMAMKTSDYKMVKTLMAEHMAAIDAMNMSPKQKSDKKEKAVQDISTAYGVGLARNHPELLLQMLRDPAQGAAQDTTQGTAQGTASQSNTSQPVQSDFNGTMDFIFSHEGGYKAHDGNTTNPVNFGINQKAHPEVNVKNLTKDQATQIYKKQYWEAIGGDKLAPDVALMAMDAAVNQGVDFAKKIIKDADGDVNAMAQMRRDKYDALVKANPSLYGSNAKGWANRVNDAEKQATALGNVTTYPLMDSPPADTVKTGDTGNTLLDSLPWEKRTQLIKQAETQINHQQDEIVKKNAIYGSNLEINVNRGQASYSEIDKSYADGLITAAKRTELTLNVDKQAEVKAKELEKQRMGIDSVVSSLNGGRKLDYKNSEDKTGVGNYFSLVLAPSIKDQPPEVQSQAIADFSAKTGILPEVIQGQIRGSFRAGNPQEIAYYADMLDRIKTANPSVVNDFSEEEIATGNMVNTYIRSGMKPEAAIALTKNNLTVPEPERKARSERYAASKLQKDNSKYLTSEATGSALFGWIGQKLPAHIPDAMAGEFESLVQAEYTRSGDVEPARKTALEIMRKTWGVSNIGETRWMKYPPEQMYAVQGEDSKWIENQLYKEVLPTILSDGSDITLTLESTTTTARERNPSYLVMQKKDGYLKPVMGVDGKTARFRPDYASSDANKKRVKEVADKQKENQSILNAATQERLHPTPAEPLPSDSFNYQ